MVGAEHVNYQFVAELSLYLDKKADEGEEVTLSPTDARLAALGLSMLADSGGYVRLSIVRDIRTEAP